MLGVAEKKAILDRYNELAMNYSDETADEMAQLQDEIDAGTCGISTARSTSRWTRCAARPTMPMSKRFRAANAAASRCASCCSKSPTCCSWTNRPTTSTPNHRLAAKHLIDYPGTILIVTHDRYFLDDITGWILELDRGRGHPLRGQLFRLAGTEGQAAGAGSARGQGQAEDAGTRTGMDPRRRQGPAGQGQGPHQRLREWPARPSRKRHRADHHPNGERLGGKVIEVGA
jgi:hypothetical protein